MPRFDAALLWDPTIPGGYMKHYVPVPDAVAESLRAAGHDRVKGSIGGHPFRRALYRRSDGWCLRFGESWLRDAALEVGAVVRVELEGDADGDGVDLPEELEAALSRDPEVLRAWRALTPGRRRTLAYPVERAKRPETRAQRAKAVVEEVRKLLGGW